MAVTVTEWTAASNRLFKQNISSTTSTTATSLGTGNLGPNGCDVAFPIQLSSSRWLWTFGDTFWPTAAGQTRLQSPFIGNCVMHQVGADPSTAAATWYCGARPGTTTVSNTEPWPYFNSWEYAPRFQSWDAELGLPGAFKYPMCGIKLQSNCILVLGMLHMSNNWAEDLPLAVHDPFFGDQYYGAPGRGFNGIGAAADTFPVGPWAELLWSTTSVETTAPNTWVHQEVEVDLPRSWAGFGQRTSFSFQYGAIVEGDKLYVWCMGPWDQSGHVSVCRYPLSEVLQGIMRAPEWWAGDDRWQPDRPNAQRRLRVSPERVRSEQGGAVFRRPDGRLQMMCVPEPFFDPFESSGGGGRQQGPAHISYSIANEPGAVFEKLDDAYLIPNVANDYDFRYSAYAALGQSGAGMGANDLVAVYNTHSTDPLGGGVFDGRVFTDTRIYVPHVVQIAGI